MILADTGALYAISVEGEKNHKNAAAFFLDSLNTGVTLAITQMIISDTKSSAHHPAFDVRHLDREPEGSIAIPLAKPHKRP